MKIEHVAVAVVATAFAASAAFAGQIAQTPGPLIGAGIPALAGLAYVYKRVRRARGE